MKKKSKTLDLELTSSSMLIETGGKKMKKLLIIYYSWSNGNTERIAKMLQSETDSDILKIDTVVPYSGSYDDVVNQGQNEVQRGYEPEIKPLDINIADYDVIAVGTPTWWYTMAPPAKSQMWFAICRYSLILQVEVIWRHIRNKLMNGYRV